MEAPNGVVGFQSALGIAARTVGYDGREPMLVIESEQEARLYGHAHRKGVAEIHRLEIVGGVVAFLHGLRSAAVGFYRAVDQRAAVQANSDPGSAPVEFGTKYELHRHIDIMKGVFGAGLEAVGVVIIAVAIHFAAGAYIFYCRPDIKHLAAVQRDVHEHTAIDLRHGAAALDGDVAIAVIAVHGVRKTGKVRTRFDPDGDLSLGSKRY